MKPRWMCTGDVRFCRKFEFRKTAIFVHKIDRGLDSAEYLLFAESVITGVQRRGTAAPAATNLSS
jgi:hypothetical protein